MKIQKEVFKKLTYDGCILNDKKLFNKFEISWCYA